MQTQQPAEVPEEAPQTADEEFIEDALLDLLDGIVRSGKLTGDVCSAVAYAVDPAEKVAAEMERLRQVERDFRTDQQWAIGWLEGCMKAFDVLPGSETIRRWADEVQTMRAEVGKIANVVADTAKAEAILRRIHASEPDPPAGGARVMTAAVWQ